MTSQPEKKLRGRRRDGAVSVEFAFVAILLFMLLFGIFEYCRFLFVIHVTNNAARDAARFAVVHTNGGTMPGEPATISQADIISIMTTGKIGATTYGAGMSGFESNITSYNVEVFYPDRDQLALNPPVITPASGKAWNDAPFADKICVRVTGTYKPAVPSLLLMGSDIPFKVVVMYSSEAN